MSGWDLEKDSGHEDMMNDIIESSKSASTGTDSIVSTELQSGNSQNTQANKNSGEHHQHRSVSDILATEPGYLKVAYFDASAIVKLLINDGISLPGAVSELRFGVHCVLRRVAGFIHQPARSELWSLNAIYPHGCHFKEHDHWGGLKAWSPDQWRSTLIFTTAHNVLY